MPTANQIALVTSIKADLIARGVIPVKQEDNGDSFQITGRVAWALRSQGAKLIGKTSPAQNGWTIEDGPRKGQRVSHDGVAFPDGWVDVLTGAGPPANVNGPAWQWHSEPPAGYFVEPYDLDALIEPVDPVEPDEPTDPGTVPMPDLIGIIHSAIAAGLVGATAQMVADIADIKRVQAAGLSGTLFGYRVTLTPPTKGNGQG